MTYTFEQLKEDVKKEAEALRVHATQEELAKLDTEIFDPGLSDLCCYGLMTGSCGSPRAHELISKCCVRLIDNEDFDAEANSLEEVRSCLPKSATELSKFRKTEGTTYLKYVSPIEAYIMLEDARNANLIAYLRGETETLEL